MSDIGKIIYNNKIVWLVVKPLSERLGDVTSDPGDRPDVCMNRMSLRPRWIYQDRIKKLFAESCNLFYFRTVYIKERAMIERNGCRNYITTMLQLFSAGCDMMNADEGEK